MHLKVISAGLVAAALLVSSAYGQIGRRWPSEKKVVPDPVTGIPLSFLTTSPGGDSKIYQTHQQWTADGKWLIFRGTRGTGAQAFAVNEESGDIVQVTENGYMGMLCNAHKSMKLFIMRSPGGGSGRGGGRGPAALPAATAAAAPARLPLRRLPLRRPPPALDRAAAAAMEGSRSSRSTWPGSSPTAPPGP